MKEHWNYGMQYSLKPKHYCYVKSNATLPQPRCFKQERPTRLDPTEPKQRYVVMNAKCLLVGLAVMSQWAVAEDAQQYQYGQKLDVAKVISTQSPEGCEVGEATMVYQDSQGKTHTLVYLRQGDNCTF